MIFASDNWAPAHPAVMAAVMAANEGPAPAYGADPWTERLTERVREVFEAPGAAVALVATGGAANALALATMARPWSGIACTEMAHVREDEAGGVEAMTGGAQLIPLPAPDARMDPADLRAAYAACAGRGVHGVAPGPVTITNLTEKGTLYTAAQTGALAAVARDFGQGLHLDGARLANALAATGASPADLTWRAGVTALSLGGTKNGLMGAEAVVLFDPSLADDLMRRRKRAGHLLSKSRYLAAQMLAWLEDGLWLRLAADANARLARLADGLRAVPGVELVWEPAGNIAFLRAPRHLHAALHDAGARYHLWDGELDGPPDAPVTGRLVCSWATPVEEVDRMVTLAARAGA